MAAVDITVAQAEVIGQIGAVVSVGLVVLMVYVAVSAFRTIRDAFFGESSGGDRLAEIRAHAQQLQEAGEGQSAEYADHVENVRGSAYDAGYMGREFDPSLGEQHRGHFEKAQRDRAEDDAKGWNKGLK